MSTTHMSLGERGSWGKSRFGHITILFGRHVGTSAGGLGVMVDTIEDTNILLPV